MPLSRPGQDLVTSPGQETFLKLYRNGELLGETTDRRFGVENVPAEGGEFKLTAAYARTSELATKTEATWTFRSRAADREALPLWAVRFQPPVDRHNTVAGRPISVLPLTLQKQPDAKAGAIGDVRVQISGDHGKTWTPATVIKTGPNRYSATFRTPPAATHISLKAQAADTSGNTVDQTIHSAYRLMSLVGFAR